MNRNTHSKDPHPDAGGPSSGKTPDTPQTAPPLNFFRPTPPVLQKSRSWEMFDRISSTYDPINRVLSLGRDQAWRRKIADHLPEQNNQTVLDLATGTGDVPLALFEKSDRILRAYGIDLADQMLDIGRIKIAQEKMDHCILLQHGDANQIPYSDDNFDAVTMAFGIRNVSNPVHVLKEIYRVLKPGGRVVILEFSLSPHFLLKTFQILYLRLFVPLIGGLLSGDFPSYRYLNTSIEHCPYGPRFCRMVEQVGFQEVQAFPLFFSAATIYRGDKA